MVRYLSVAQKIVSYGYDLSDDSVITVTELLQLAGSEDEVEHILHDDATKRANRLKSLESGLARVLADYGRRRLRAPLVQTSVVGSYKSAFWAQSSGNVGEAPSELERRRRFRLVPEFRNLLYGLTPRQFEHVCGEVLRSVGCRNVTVSQASKDDGADAVAALPMSIALVAHTPLHRLAGAMSFLVYAQAKRYSAEHPVEQDEVFEVQGSWTAMRHGFANGTLSEKVRSSLVQADYKSADPVFLIMLTTSRFSAGAEAKADAMGILLMDGEQIAQLLIEREYGLVRGTSGEWQLDVLAVTAPLTAAG